MPLSAGSASNSLRQAPRPPAEAPMPTTGKSSAPGGGPREMGRGPDPGDAALAWSDRLSGIMDFLSDDPNDNGH